MRYMYWRKNRNCVLLNIANFSNINLISKKVDMTYEHGIDKIVSDFRKIQRFCLSFPNYNGNGYGTSRSGG